ncbi:hypothetical protein F5Y13DRAFT_172875 [Hypoxylon sp. FL1857]|nr:hypothetical protein F5Y13DRAFT_172875 [Hypoxylon sp. FL1857]
MAKFTSLFHISIWLLAGHVSCGSIAAWWNTRGPSFIMQDDDTGGIRYSLCNGNHTPIFPDDKTLTTPYINHPPKNKSSLAATGWTDSDTAWASIFYLDNNDNIVNALLKCDWNTGHWQITGEYITSEGSPKVAPTSALSAVLLGSTDGYRVFYNDLEGTLHQVGYTSATTWAYYGTISHDTTSTQAIASTFSGKNISIVRPRDDKNIGVSRWYTDNLWHLSTFPEPLTLEGNKSTNATQASDLKLSSDNPPFSLPAWDGNVSALAMGIDSAYTRSVFYIGTDRKLYQVGNKNYQWSVFSRPSAGDNAWPLADTPGAPIGIANDFSTNIMRLYYMSGGRMIEANGDGGIWQTATVLASSNASQPTSSPTPSTTDAPPSEQGGGGLSDGAKVGISVGVTLGVIALAGMGFAFWFLRWRQRKLDEAAAEAAAAGSVRSPGSAYVGPTTTTFSASGTQVGDQSVSGLPKYSTPPPQAATGYSPLQTAYGQPQQGMFSPPQMGYAPSADGYAQGTPTAAYPQQAGFVQEGGWTYATAVADNGAPQQQYYYQQPQQHPHEMPEQRRPVEMMGEGHYSEVP